MAEVIYQPKPKVQLKLLLALTSKLLEYVFMINLTFILNGGATGRSPIAAGSLQRFNGAD